MTGTRLSLRAKCYLSYVGGYLGESARCIHIYDQEGLLDAAIKPCISNQLLLDKPCVLYLTSREAAGPRGALALEREGERLAFETEAEGRAAGDRYAGKVACCHPHGADMSATLHEQGN